MGKPPALLTVEEACLLLRVGRTKGYAMAKEWRESGGASGLPVIDLGDVLRVPLVGLEKMTGAKFDDEAEIAPSDAGIGRGDIGGPGEAGMAAPSADPTPEPRRASPAVRSSRNRSTRSRRASTRPSNQLDLFEPPTATPTA